MQNETCNREKTDEQITSTNETLKMNRQKTYKIEPSISFFATSRDYKL